MYSQQQQPPSSTQRLQQYIDQLKSARLSSQQQNDYSSSSQQIGASSSNTHTPNTTTYGMRPEPRDMLELEFMDSLDARLNQLEQTLDHRSLVQGGGNTSPRNRNFNTTNNSSTTTGGGVISPAPPTTTTTTNTTTSSSNALNTTPTTLAERIQQQQQQQQQQTNEQVALGAAGSGLSSSARRGFLYNQNRLSSSASTTSSHPGCSLVFRITLPFLRSNVVDAASGNSECASFLVHVADLSQTGDDLLWHIVAQARIRFPDLMQVGGFEWTPGAASSLCLFALSSDEIDSWVSRDQARVGAIRNGGAFLHYDAATPLHRYIPIAAALKKRQMKPTGAVDMMSRAVRDLNPQADVEVFVLMKSLIPHAEFQRDNLRRGIVMNY